MKTNVLLIIILLLSSCATLVNTKYTKVTVTTYPEGAKVVVNKEDTFCCTPQLIFVKRKDEPLRITAIKDSFPAKTMMVDYKASFPYLANTVFWYGYLIDLTNNKRFTYPKHVYIDMINPKESYQGYPDWHTHPERTFNIVASIPAINFYYYDANNQNETIKGYLGLTVSAEYYLSQKNYISLQYGGLDHADNSRRGVIFTNYDSWQETHRKLDYVNVRINRRTNDNFHFGIGVSYQAFKKDHNQNIRYFDSNRDFPPYGQEIDTSYNLSSLPIQGIGLSLSAQAQLSRTLFLGTMFQPILFNTGKSASGYFHYLNFELIYKLPVMHLK